MREVEWRIDQANNRVIRSGSYAGVAAIAVLASIGVVGLIITVIRATYTDSVWPVVLLIAIILIAGPISIRTVLAFRELDRNEWALLTRVDDPANDPSESLHERIAPYYSGWHLGIIASLSAALTVVLMIIEAWLIVPTLVLLFGWQVIASGLESWGRIVPEEPRFESYGGEIPLDEIAGYRSVRLGEVIVCWLSYTTGGLAVSRRSFLTFTPAAFEVFENILEELPQRPTRRDPADTVVIAVPAIFGLLFLLIAVGIGVIQSIPLTIRMYLTIVMGIFASASSVLRRYTSGHGCVLETGRGEGSGRSVLMCGSLSLRVANSK